MWKPCGHAWQRSAVDVFLYKPGVHGEQVPSSWVEPVRVDVMPVLRHHHGLFWYSINALVPVFPSLALSDEPYCSFELLVVPAVNSMLSMSTLTSAKKILTVRCCRTHIKRPLMLQSSEKDSPADKDEIVSPHCCISEPNALPESPMTISAPSKVWA